MTTVFLKLDPTDATEKLSSAAFISYAGRSTSTAVKLAPVCAHLHTIETEALFHKESSSGITVDENAKK